ncbi:MAG: hypothetical protein Q8P41_13540 [Pseudomonadota bacterium]|nr:hypothetical protein [Pseudomonadota bacterium]
MNIALKGTSPATMVAGILVLSRARSFGQRVKVEIVGDPGDIGIVEGPAILHSAPLASCGVGREYGSGALVVVPGPARSPLAVSLTADGRSDWFYVDRSGEGVHPATKAFVRYRRDPRSAVRAQVRVFLHAADVLGFAPEPAVLDLLFGAPVPPLTRIALALRAGRALSGERGAPVTAYLGNEFDEEAGVSLASTLSRLAPALRVEVEAFVRAAEEIATADGDRAWVDGLSELGAHLSLLPPQSMLPPLSPAADAVAFGLGRALGATQGNAQAQAGLLETYRFLGGKFTDSAPWPVELPSDPPPADGLGRWSWFCSHVSVAAEQADRLWRNLVDPPM